MTDEWPKLGDDVALRVEFAARLEGRRDGRPATYFIVFPRSREWPPIAVERERIAPWRSARVRQPLSPERREAFEALYPAIADAVEEHLGRVEDVLCDARASLLHLRDSASAADVVSRIDELLWPVTAPQAETAAERGERA